MTVRNSLLGICQEKYEEKSSVKFNVYVMMSVNSSRLG